MPGTARALPAVEPVLEGGTFPLSIAEMEECLSAARSARLTSRKRGNASAGDPQPGAAEADDHAEDPDQHAAIRHQCGTALAELARRGADAHSQEDMLALAANLGFVSPTEQYLALLHVRSALKRQQREPQHLPAQVEAAAAHLEARHGTEIRASVFAYLGAREHQLPPARMAEVQHVYCALVLGTTQLSAMLKLVLQRFPGRSLQTSIQALLSGLGRDISATRGPAMLATLRILVSDVNYLQAAATGLLRCNAEVERLGLPAQDRGKRAEKLMLAIAEMLTVPALSLANFRELGTSLQVKTAPAHAQLMNAVYGTLRDFPSKLFVDERHRQAVLQAALRAQDDAVNVEQAVSASATAGQR